MTSVPRRAAFRYGFYLFSYWLVLVAVCAGLVAGGVYALDVGVSGGSLSVGEDGAAAAAGGFAVVLGVLVYGAGQTGLVYKLVADGARTGVAAAVAPSDDAASSATDEADETDRSEQPAGPSDAPAPAAAATSRRAMTTAPNTRGFGSSCLSFMTLTLSSTLSGSSRLPGVRRPESRTAVTR